MSSSYVIVKASRVPKRASADNAYRGPTAKTAGVEPGKIYDTYETAKRDAVKLASWNRCGFVVLEVID